MEELEIAKYIASRLDFHKGDNVILKDVSNKTPLTSYFIICSADTSRKLNGLKDIAIDELYKKGVKIHHVEAKGDTCWILIDAYYLIIHILTTSAREKYNLEKLYQDCDDINFNK